MFSQLTCSVQLKSARKSELSYKNRFFSLVCNYSRPSNNSRQLIFNINTVVFVTMQNRWNNRISDGCVYAQIRKGLGMHLVTYSNHDTVPFLLIVPIKGRFV